MADTNAITVRGLKKSFDRRPVLDFLDLSIAQGEAVGLLGANGAGKTTLLKSLLGLQPIDAGHCVVLGDSSFSLSPAVRARLAYVPQNPNQFPWLTGKAMLRYISAFFPLFDWDYVRDLTGRWKLALATPIGQLSPGQQQRLSIVRALATRPDVIMLDEPIASLDPATRIAVIDELVSERGRRPITIVFSSHLIGDLERLCTQFAVLEAGRISVIEEIAWFRNLVRVTLQGSEADLEQMFVPRPLHIRKTVDGRRIAVVDRCDIDRWSATLPSTVRLTLDEPDLETVTSEWMQ